MCNFLKTTIVALTFAILLTAGSSEAETSNGIEISGFGDILFNISENNGTGNKFKLGQVELDIGAAAHENISIEVAIAYGEESFELGAFLVDFHVFGTEGKHFRPAHGIKHSGIIAGQFDVPFGIDWKVYPSIDRKLISSPLAVNNTHDSWNDLGIQLYIEKQWLNGIVYAVNGFGYEEEDDSGYVQLIEMKAAFGGRLGIVPVEYLEIGGSFASLIAEEDKRNMILAGADAQFNYADFSVKGEYIAHKFDIPAGGNLSNNGFYIKGMYDFGSFYSMARYGAFYPDEPNTDDITRFSAGAGWVISDNCELRFEYQDNSGGTDNAGLLQLAIGF